MKILRQNDFSKFNSYYHYLRLNYFSSIHIVIITNLDSNNYFIVPSTFHSHNLPIIEQTAWVLIFLYFDIRWSTSSWRDDFRFQKELIESSSDDGLIASLIELVLWPLFGQSSESILVDIWWRFPSNFKKIVIRCLLGTYFYIYLHIFLVILKHCLSHVFIILTLGFGRFRWRIIINRTSWINISSLLYA